MPACESKLKAHAERRGKGVTPQPPQATPEPHDQINLTDAARQLMRKSHNEAFEQSYNAQVAVCAYGSQLIVGVRVSQSVADNSEMEASLAAKPAQVDRPAHMLVESGCINSEAPRARDGQRCGCLLRNRDGGRHGASSLSVSAAGDSKTRVRTRTNAFWS